MTNVLFLDIGSRFTKYTLIYLSDSSFKSFNPFEKNNIEKNNIEKNTTEILKNEDKNNFYEVLALGLADTEGINYQRVIDYSLYEDFINSLINDIKKETGRNIDVIFLSVGGANLYSVVSNLKIDVNNQEITHTFLDDYLSKKAKIGKIQADNIVTLPEDFENIISILPRLFIIDSVDKTYNPIGLTAKNNIEIELFISSIKGDHKKNIAKPFEKLGFEVTDNINLNSKNALFFIPNVLAYNKAISHSSFSSKKLRDLPPLAIIDLGYSITELIVILEAAPYLKVYIKRGLKNILKDISFALGVTLEEAENILLNINISKIYKDDEYMEINPFFYSNSNVIQKEKVQIHSLIDTVIIPRVEEIAKLLKSALANSFSYSLISNILLVGGGAEIKGIDKIIYNIFEIRTTPFKINKQYFGDYRLTNLYGMVEVFVDKIYQDYKRNKYEINLVKSNKVKGIIEKISDFFKNFF
jgi:cell division protein FtsA